MPPHDPSLVAEEVLTDSLVLVSSKAFSLPGLERLLFILREKGSGTRELFVKLLETRGVTIRGNGFVTPVMLS